MKIFETISFHIIKPCNMKCKFCYATFEDISIPQQLSYEQACTILLKLSQAGVEKITFAGGEPMLYKHLDNCIIYAKSLGLTTSIITNGSRIKEQWLIDMQPHLDWIGLSIDSLNPVTNQLIGREAKMFFDYLTLATLINKYNYRLKINTVVNIHNQHEIMKDFINTIKVDRWKIFDTLKVKEQNDAQYDSIKSTDFNQFIENNKHKTMVVEDNNLMTGSYLLVDPIGRFFENSKGKHTYSSSLLTNSVEECLKQITINRSTFLKRGGIYNWTNPTK